MTIPYWVDQYKTAARGGVEGAVASAQAVASTASEYLFSNHISPTDGSPVGSATDAMASAVANVTRSNWTAAGEAAVAAAAMAACEAVAGAADKMAAARDGDSLLARILIGLVGFFLGAVFIHCCHLWSQQKRAREEVAGEDADYAEDSTALPENPESNNHMAAEGTEEAMHTEDEEEERQEGRAHALSDMDAADEHTTEHDEDLGAESSELDEGDGDAGRTLTDFAIRAQYKIGLKRSTMPTDDTTTGATTTPWQWPQASPKRDPQESKVDENSAHDASEPETAIVGAAETPTPKENKDSTPDRREVSSRSHEPMKEQGTEDTPKNIGLGGDWQSNYDTPHRREMIQHIVKLLKKDKNGSPESLNKLPQMAKQLEVSLYRSARSLKAYMDRSTLKARLQQINLEVRCKASSPSLRASNAVPNPEPTFAAAEPMTSPAPEPSPARLQQIAFEVAGRATGHSRLLLRASTVVPSPEPTFAAAEPMTSPAPEARPSGPAPEPTIPPAQAQNPASSLEPTRPALGPSTSPRLTERQEEDRAAKNTNNHEDTSTSSTSSSMRQSTTSSKKDGLSKELPEGFEPGEFDVVCSREKWALNAPGNVQYRAIIKDNLQKYSATTSKKEKSTILSEIVLSIQDASPQGGFVRCVNGKWYIVADHIVREKIGQSFRDLLHTQYRSSSKKKYRRKKERDLTYSRAALHSVARVDVDADAEKTEKMNTQPDEKITSESAGNDITEEEDAEKKPAAVESVVPENQGLANGDDSATKVCSPPVEEAKEPADPAEQPNKARPEEVTTAIAQAPSKPSSATDEIEEEETSADQLNKEEGTSADQPNKAVLEEASTKDNDFLKQLSERRSSHEKEKINDSATNQAQQYRTVYDVDGETTMRILVPSEQEEAQERKPKSRKKARKGDIVAALASSNSELLALVRPTPAGTENAGGHLGEDRDEHNPKSVVTPLKSTKAKPSTPRHSHVKPPSFSHMEEGAVMASLRQGRDSGYKVEDIPEGKACFVCEYCNNWCRYFRSNEPHFGDFKYFEDKGRYIVDTSEPLAEKINISCCLSYRKWRSHIQRHLDQRIPPAGGPPKLYAAFPAALRKRARKGPAEGERPTKVPRTWKKDS